MFCNIKINLGIITGIALLIVFFIAEGSPFSGDFGFSHYGDVLVFPILFQVDAVFMS